MEKYTLAGLVGRHVLLGRVGGEALFGEVIGVETAGVWIKSGKATQMLEKRMTELGEEPGTYEAVVFIPMSTVQEIILSEPTA